MQMALRKATFWNCKWHWKSPFLKQVRCRTNFALPPFCVESCCCAFYGDVTENSRRFCFRLILHAPQCKEYRAKPRFETAKCIEKSHVLKQVRWRTNFELPPFCVECCCCAFLLRRHKKQPSFLFSPHFPCGSIQMVSGKTTFWNCKVYWEKPRFETGALPYKFQITSFFNAKGRFVSEICTKLRLNFLQTVVVR